jgi:hypothetical protein
MLKLQRNQAFIKEVRQHHPELIYFCTMTGVDLVLILLLTVYTGPVFSNKWQQIRYSNLKILEKAGPAFAITTTIMILFCGALKYTHRYTDNNGHIAYKLLSAILTCTHRYTANTSQIGI